MWPFNRRSAENREDVPPEVQDYYQAEKRERTGVAWMLGLATVVITILLALALFFGGRWLWRAVTGNDGNGGNDTAQVETPDGESRTDESEEEREAREAEEEREAREAEEEAQRQRETEQREAGEGAGNTRQTPTTGQNGSKENLPDTGPGGVAGIFAGTTALSAIAHYEFTRRRRN
jgi:hypothetical protein